MSVWLVKTEPEVYPIDRLKEEKVTQWTDVRNYQARNNLQLMKVGDKVLIYYSNSEPNGLVGIAKVNKPAYPDPTQFDKKSEYFDPKATKENPRWFAPDLSFEKEFKNLLPVSDLKKVAILKNMELFKNSRLSVQKVSDEEFKEILQLSR